MVSMMAVRASLRARAVMSSGWKAQIFWAKRVASVASPAPLRADGVDLIALPSAVMGFLPSELDSCLRLWRIAARSQRAHEECADGRHCRAWLARPNALDPNALDPNALAPSAPAPSAPAQSALAQSALAQSALAKSALAAGSSD